MWSGVVRENVKYSFLNIDGVLLASESLKLSILSCTKAEGELVY